MLYISKQSIFFLKEVIYPKNVTKYLKPTVDLHSPPRSGWCFAPKSWSFLVCVSIFLLLALSCVTTCLSIPYCHCLYMSFATSLTHLLPIIHVFYFSFTHSYSFTNVNPFFTAIPVHGLCILMLLLRKFCQLIT